MPQTIKQVPPEEDLIGANTVLKQMSAQFPQEVFTTFCYFDDTAISRGKSLKRPMSDADKVTGQYAGSDVVRNTKSVF